MGDLAGHTCLHQIVDSFKGALKRDFIRNIRWARLSVTFLMYILMGLDKSDKERQTKNLSHDGTQVRDPKPDNY